MVTWRLKTYLDAHKVSAYALAKAADVAPNTVYALARGEHKQVSLKVLGEIMEALDGLTGKRATFNDLLEREETEYEFGEGEPIPDDILEGIRRFEAGETELIPWEQVVAEENQRRGLE